MSRWWKFWLLPIWPERRHTEPRKKYGQQPNDELKRWLILEDQPLLIPRVTCELCGHGERYHATGFCFWPVGPSGTDCGCEPRRTANRGLSEETEPTE